MDKETGKQELSTITFSPKINHPPSLVSSKNSGGAQWNNPLDQKGEMLI